MSDLAFIKKSTIIRLILWNSSEEREVQYALPNGVTLDCLRDYKPSTPLDVEFLGFDVVIRYETEGDYLDYVDIVTPYIEWVDTLDGARLKVDTLSSELLEIKSTTGYDWKEILEVKDEDLYKPEYVANFALEGVWCGMDSGVYVSRELSAYESLCDAFTAAKALFPTSFQSSKLVCFITKSSEYVPDIFKESDGFDFEFIAKIEIGKVLKNNITVYQNELEQAQELTRDVFQFPREDKVIYLPSKTK